MVKNILFVSQDPGSGNALFLVIKKLLSEKDLNVTVLAAKHSKKIFQNEGIAFIDMDGKAIKELELKPDLIVAGAGSGHGLEKEAFVYGGENDIITISILDFWGNCKLRYGDPEKENESKFIPDYIFIMDDIAKKQMVEEGFEAGRLVITGNPYFDTFEKFEGEGRENKILYISQPLREGGGLKKDSLVFDDFLEAIKGVDGKVEVIIRPHPKENKDDYIQQNCGRMVVDTETDIKSLIKECSIIFGKFSMVLFEAVFSGRLVVSYQPQLKEGEFDRLVTNQLGLSYLARTKEDLKKILNGVLREEIRKNEIDNFKFYNDKKCTERVVGEIKKLFSL